jgi:transcriptional regulator with XRE-family HTH domain
MNLMKIGKFIAELRRDKGLTQEELAEKLYITDRAVSKWERGLSLPDADKMLDLCNILDINVNELLYGERIDMENYEKKTEELLLVMARQEELKNKKLMLSMWTILITSAIFYIGIILLAVLTLEEGTVLGIIICVSTFVFVITGVIAFRFEL